MKIQHRQNHMCVFVTATATVVVVEVDAFLPSMDGTSVYIQPAAALNLSSTIFHSFHKECMVFYSSLFFVRSNQVCVLVFVCV